ncbi:dUTP diphosphatase [Rossellomorea marisflavi]|uniref:dUTP diphosphatase n=1 Tax=Rossellomorea marisflavi TaxID=189381 RepID=UPI00345DCEB9
MNLKKLFDTQTILRDRINYQGNDRFDKLVLALLVEVGECANEWRGFKFWSKDQAARTKVETYYGTSITHNPLLEEYVDGLHFVLEIGIEIGCTDFTPKELISFSSDPTMKFRAIYRIASELSLEYLLLSRINYEALFNNYLHLGKSLGFTLDQIEEAYYSKNKVNHTRQDNGY